MLHLCSIYHIHHIFLCYDSSLEFRHSRNYHVTSCLVCFHILSFILADIITMSYFKSYLQWLWIDYSIKLNISLVFRQSFIYFCYISKSFFKSFVIKKISIKSNFIFFSFYDIFSFILEVKKIWRFLIQIKNNRLFITRIYGYLTIPYCFVEKRRLILSHILRTLSASL